MSSQANSTGGRTELEQVFKNTRTAFYTIGIFSLFINLLMLTAPIYMLQVYNRVLSSGSRETLVFLTIMAAGAILVMCILDTVRSSITVRIGCWLNERLSPVFMAAGVRARLKGDASGAQSFHDINAIQGFISNQGLTAFFDAPWVPIFIAIIWLLHPWLGMLALASAILLLILTFANDYATRKHVATASQTQIVATRLADTTIRNSDVVRAMGFLPALIGRWQQANAGSVDAMRRAGEAGGLVMALTKFVRFFVQVGILGLGAFLVLRHELTAGGMIAASIMLGRALAPVELAIGAWRQLMMARLAYQRLNTQLQSYPPEPPRTRLPEPAGRLKVDNLTYVVPGTTQVLLGHISFHVEPGETIAVIGPSGAGKSTLCRMLTGLMEPAAGSVRFDGSDIRHWDAQQLGRYIGYLPQDIELFDGTVSENIARMGHADDEDIVEAAMAARAHDVIQRLPEGYDTRLGVGGLQLSGGQRQRIGLARAIFGRPKLLILDEPNANLDQPGEIALTEAIETLKAQGCALVVVGHRPSTLAAADKVIVIQNGVISHWGPRDEILQRLSEGPEQAPNRHDADGAGKTDADSPAPSADIATKSAGKKPCEAQQGVAAAGNKTSDAKASATGGNGGSADDEAVAANTAKASTAADGDVRHESGPKSVKKPGVGKHKVNGAAA